MGFRASDGSHGPQVIRAWNEAGMRPWAVSVGQQCAPSSSSLAALAEWDHPSYSCSTACTSHAPPCHDQRIRLEVTSIHSAGASAAARPNASEVADGHHPIHTNLRRDWAHHGWAHPLPHLHRDGKAEWLCGLTSAPRASAFLRPWLHQQRLDSIQVPTSILLSRHRSHSHACTHRERSARR